MNAARPSPSAAYYNHTEMNATPPSQYASPSGSTYPRLGGVRCYWALLTPRFPVPGMYDSKLELKFVHPDPVLGSHLARQQMSLVGRDMLEFIHPTEVAQARQDLLGAISGDDDNSGSVTRLRFSRLSRIRKLLGGMPDEIEVPADASKYVEDDDYLIVDFSLSWCADGLILCFFHADKDKDPIADNDPMRKNEGWSNFCGSGHIPQEHVEALADDVCDHVPHECNPPHPPRRVFQIFQTHDDNPYRADKVLYSWPRPRQPGDAFDAPDGSYEYCDYRALLQDIDLTPHIKFEKTHCQSRCLLSFTSYTENVYRVINATIIPYGAIMFVRFQTVEMGPLVPKIESPIIMAPNSAVPHSATTSYRNWDPETPVRPPENVHHIPYSEPPPLQVVGPEAYPVSHYDRSRPISHGPVDIRQYDPPSHYPPTSSEYFRMPQLPIPSQLQPQYPPMPPHPPPYGQEQFQQIKPQPAPYTSSAPWTKTVSPKKPEAGPSSRPMLQPPPGVDGCIWCHTRASPEWRRSDSGIKNMCNACGLRRNRIKSKENGTARKGKRKQSPEGKST